MSEGKKKVDSSSVPDRIFETFLSRLAESGTPPETIERLRKTLLEDRKLTDRALKTALLPDDPVS